MTDTENKEKTKRKLLLKPRQIVYIVVAVIVAAILIIADFFANKYASIISTYLGVGVQLEGDTEKVEEGAKSGDEVVRKIAEEGVALLKNDNVLPLDKSNRKINIFGWAATDAGFLLTGNGSGKSLIHEDNKVTLLQAFKDSGFTYNEEIITLYENHRKDQDGDWGESGNWGERRSTTLKEPAISIFSDDVIEKAKQFSDTAVIVISRYSGEFLGRLANTQKKYDLPEDKTREYNEISTEEEALVKLVTKEFQNVIVIFNTGSIFDMTFTDNDAEFGHIGAVMNVGYMGQSGTTAIPKILTGEVNPSGKLADTVVYNPKENEIARTTSNTADIVYFEDIYIGYKFYETADVEGYYNGKSFLGKTGYDAVVQYPFGHGLSYTDFEWEIESTSLADGESLLKTSEIEIKVRVTNTGSVAGKDVVQLYFTPPYYDGGIEKAAVSLLGFEKTAELKPGESQVVTFEFTPYELASYDCYDRNETGSTGWELDMGEYQIKLMTDSHHLKQMEKNTLTYKVEDFIIRYSKDPDTNGRIKNRFTGDTAYGECPLDGSNLETDWTYLSRSDFAGTRTTGVATSPANRIIAKYGSYYYDSYNYTAKPVTGVDSGLRLVTKGDGSYVSKAEFDGTKTYDGELKFNEELIFKLGDPEYWNDGIWNTFLNQLTEDELRAFVEDGGYGTRSVESIGKPQWLDYDGPSGFNNTNLAPNVKGAKMTALPAENLVAQTWNKELVFQAGQIIGIDGQNFGLAGIYAPGINLHREYLNGRNYEYYSEDPILSGYLAANFCLGAKSNGVYCFAKHLALFDSSSLGYDRVWCTEQNLRENYLKPFEIAIKKGGATGVMVSFNNMGATWSGANKELLDGVLRTEFGFKGMFVTDFDMGTEACWQLRHGIRAGLNTQLNPAYGNASQYGKLDMSDVTDVNLARESAKSIVYAYCNTYYFAKNNDIKTQYSVEIAGPRTIKKGFDWWILAVVFINIIAFGLLIWRGLFNFVPALQRFSENRKVQRVKRKEEKLKSAELPQCDADALAEQDSLVYAPPPIDGDPAREVGGYADELKAATQRIDELEAKIQELDGKLAAVLNELAEAKAKKPKSAAKPKQADKNS